MSQATYIYDLSKTFLTCIVDRLTELELPIPCRVCVVPGQIAYDSCVDGQLAISKTQQYYSQNFPQPMIDDSTLYECSNVYVVAEFRLSLMRCAPVPESPVNTEVPCDRLDASALEINQDSYAIQTGLRCCLDALIESGHVAEYTMGVVQTVGPQGGCVGTEVTFRVGLAWLGS